MTAVETGQISEKDFEEVLSKTPEDLQNWIEDQELEPRKMELWLFHYWMRHHTDLKPGTRVDYRKEVAQHWEEIDDNEEDGVDLFEASSQRRSAVNKYRAFLGSEFLENHSRNRKDEGE